MRTDGTKNEVIVVPLVARDARATRSCRCGSILRGHRCVLPTLMGCPGACAVLPPFSMIRAAERYRYCVRYSRVGPSGGDIFLYFPEEV